MNKNYSSFSFSLSSSKLSSWAFPSLGCVNNISTVDSGAGSKVSTNFEVLTKVLSCVWKSSMLVEVMPHWSNELASMCLSNESHISLIYVIALAYPGDCKLPAAVNDFGPLIIHTLIKNLKSKLNWIACMHMHMHM